MTANTAYTASRHEATKNSFSRRALIGGTAALGAVGLLSACGNGSASSEKTKAAGAGANIEDLYNINAQDVNSLKKGGTLRLPAGAIGPNFNFHTQSGNTTDNVNVMSTISQAGLWNLDFDGTYKLNTDFAVSFEHTKKDDKIQVAIKLNPKAVFTDGTPITYKALQSTWNVLRAWITVTTSLLPVSTNSLNPSKRVKMTTAQPSPSPSPTTRCRISSP